MPIGVTSISIILRNISINQNSDLKLPNADIHYQKPTLTISSVVSSLPNPTVHNYYSIKATDINLMNNSQRLVELLPWFILIKLSTT